MLTYKRFDQLEVIGYSDSDLAGCPDVRKSTYGFIFMMVEELFLGKVLNKHLQLAQLWKQSMSLVMRLLVKPCG